MNDKSQPVQIEAVFRNGSVTVVGVILGSSLTYLTSWASYPVPRQLHDLIGIVPLAIGVAFQLFAPSALLHTDSLERPFLNGLVLVCIGLVSVVAVDTVLAARRS